MIVKPFHILPPPMRPPVIWGVRIDGKRLVLFSTKHRALYIVPATGRKGWDIAGDCTNQSGDV